MSLRIAFYSHDTFGLGHLVRCLKVAGALRARLGPLRGLLITGSPWADLFTPPAGFAYLQLPPVIKSGPDTYVPRAPGTLLPPLLRARRARIAAGLRHFRPDMFVVDNVPCGLYREVIPALRALKAGGGTKLVLALREILDLDDTVRAQWSANGAFGTLEELYDEIWVFGPVGAPVASMLPPAIARKTVFCGYLEPLRRGANLAAQRRPERHTGSPSRRPRILVTGGGGSDAGRLVDTYVGALRRFRPAVTSRIVLGPDYLRSNPEPALDDADATIVSFDPDLPASMACSDLVVSMAGYHTVSELLAAGRRAVLVPRVWPRAEQWLRTRSPALRGNVEVLHPEDLSTSTLWKAIEAALALPAPRPQRMMGGEIAGRRAAELLGTDPRGGI